jgi:hypothetical protein
LATLIPASSFSPNPVSCPVSKQILSQTLPRQKPYQSKKINT